MKRNMACFVAFIGLFYVVGFWLLASALWSAWRSSRASNWPTVPAAITRVEVKENPNSDGETYEVEVRYTYTVNGVAYEGSRLAFGYEASSNRLTHDEIHHKLKEAKAVNVRYDPSDPTVSCLSFGLHRSIQVKLAFAVTWLVFMAGFTLLFWLFSRSDTVLLDNLAAQ